MFRFRKARPPLTTFQRVDIELLMRKTIETIGTTWVRRSPVVVDLAELQLETSNPAALLRSAKSEVTRRFPPMEVPCEIEMVEAEEAGFPSTYQVGDESRAAKIAITDKTLSDPLRTVMELSNRYSSHFWNTRPMHTSLDTDPRTTHLLPICCGFGVLASEACLYDDQWTQAGWAGWSISRSGYYSTVELGYAMSLLARARGEDDPPWTGAMRLDSKVTAQQAWRYFQQHEESGGTLLFDAASIPSSKCDVSQLASWLAGDDLAFALAAGYALLLLDDLPSVATQAALVATDRGDPDLLPVAARVIGKARTSSPELESRLRYLIRKGAPRASLAAVQAAHSLGMPLAIFGRRISKLLDQFAEDSFALVEVIGQQGDAFRFMVPKICEHIAIALREQDSELVAAFLQCLQRIDADPRCAIEKQIRSPEIRRAALEQLEQLEA